MIVLSTSNDKSKNQIRTYLAKNLQIILRGKGTLLFQLNDCPSPFPLFLSLYEFPANFRKVMWRFSRSGDDQLLSRGSRYEETIGYLAPRRTEQDFSRCDRGISFLIVGDDGPRVTPDVRVSSRRRDVPDGWGRECQVASRTETRAEGDDKEARPDWRRPCYYVQENSRYVCRSNETKTN